jgi:hypothetical protein
VVVVVEPRIAQRLRLVRFEHAERHAGFKPHRLHAANHVFDRLQMPVFRIAPRGAHAETRRAVLLRHARGGQHGVHFHQLLGLDARFVVRRLRAVRAVFLAAARLDREQRGELHGIRVEVLAMHLLRAEQQVVERQIVERDHVGDFPARAGGVRRGGLHGGRCLHV